MALGMRAVVIASLVAVLLRAASDSTIALWPFDEAEGLYPSSVLDDVSANDYPLVLGPGGRLVEGKFGRALDTGAQPEIRYPDRGPAAFGLAPTPVPAGRSVEPMTWRNALFCALMTRGETHLRKEVGFPNPTATKLNLGASAWTVEFWYRAARPAAAPGVVFEIGRGPRGENEAVTRLLLQPDGPSFQLVNQPGGVRLSIPTDAAVLLPAPGAWHHLAFVHSAAGSVRHYVDGREQRASPRVRLQALPAGAEAYLTVGRDGLWQRPLPGAIDELRFSEGEVYTASFVPPGSFSPLYRNGAGPVNPVAGLPLLFGGSGSSPAPVPLLGRKHLLLDGALFERMDNVIFTANPPRPAERVIDDIRGAFRKHLSVVEDASGLIRMYFGVENDHLAVLTSRDGIHWEKPALGGEAGNVVLTEPAATGAVFLDPNGPAGERWKLVSGYGGRGIYLYSSPDGWRFRRHPIAVLPFRAASQSAVFYDDQRGLYVGYHRTDYPATLGGRTQREFVRTETADIARPWPFRPVTAADVERARLTKRLQPLAPWYLDNGPLTPGGFGIEYPTAFAPDDALDPPGTDIYVPKALKYPWAPDAYLAFPLVYFHYEDEGPPARRVLGEVARGRGSGPIEAQLAVSRDGLRWRRFPRPAYAGVGTHSGDVIRQVYLGHGMVRRGPEIWQYYFGEEAYHSSWRKGLKRAVYRLVQRADGFVAAEAPYGAEGLLVSRPLLFEGNRLVLNVDTGATGYAQAGLTDASGRPADGFGLDDCVYLNGNAVDAEVEWLRRGKDVASLAGKPVRLLVRMRGARLYALQFVRR